MKGKKMTIKELLARLEKHEEICAVRLENIEKRLDEGSKRFIRLEYYIWGIYAAIFISAFASKLL
tara:strand:+ start:241 stop:435 length:195 start_codon:yes stop_codon:yes gene_type:complete